MDFEKVFALGCILVIMMLIGWGWHTTISWQPYDGQQRIACVMQGGIWGTGECMWSRPNE